MMSTGDAKHCSRWLEHWCTMGLHVSSQIGLTFAAKFENPYLISNEEILLFIEASLLKLEIFR